jgi:hypothetical protein
MGKSVLEHAAGGRKGCLLWHDDGVTLANLQKVMTLFKDVKA